MIKKLKNQQPLQKKSRYCAVLIYCYFLFNFVLLSFLSASMFKQNKFLRFPWKLRFLWLVFFKGSFQRKRRNLFCLNMELSGKKPKQNWIENNNMSIQHKTLISFVVAADFFFKSITLINCNNQLSRRVKLLYFIWNFSHLRNGCGACFDNVCAHTI